MLFPTRFQVGSDQLQAVDVIYCVSNHSPKLFPSLSSSVYRLHFIILPGAAVKLIFTFSLDPVHEVAIGTTGVMMTWT